MRIAIETDVETEARDGTLLRADVWRPADAGGPLPALLQRTPYDKAQAVRDPLIDLPRLVRAGYAVVVQDVRGRFASDGAFEPFRHEAADGADAVAWAAAQPWCDGSVGMFGASYVGAAQWLAASAAPPALRAIAPLLTAADVHGAWAYRGGAFELGFALLWNAAHLAGEEGGAAVDDFDAVARRRPLRALADGRALGRFHGDWLDHPARDPWWDELAPVATPVVPALLVGGWHDLFLHGTLADHARLHAAGVEARLVVGPWSHEVYGGAFPERDYGAQAAADAVDLTALHLRWFDRHLRGASGPPDLRGGGGAPGGAGGRAPGDGDAPVRIFVTGADAWRDAAAWPPAETVAAPWALGADGVLRSGSPQPADAGADDWTHDPDDPVPTLGGATFLPGQAVGARCGPRDRRELALRPDVLVYESEPLAEAVELAGAVALVVHLSSSAPDTDVTGALCDVAPDGRAELLTDGILRARWRGSPIADPGRSGSTPGPAERTEPRPLRPGAVHELRVDLGATAHRFAAGHRIRLEVASSNFPRFDRNGGSGGPIALEGDADVRIARNRVHRGPAHPSRLLLPVAG